MNKTLVLNDIEVNKKYFYDFKKAIPLNLVDTNNIAVSNKVKNNNDTSKYFIGYMHDIDAISPLCIILPQMTGYIKYFENGMKNMPFKIEDEAVYIKPNQIWNKIKDWLNVRLHSEPIYDDKYIKIKVKTFSNIINTLFTDDKIPKERVHYICIAAICIDSVLRKDKKNYPQVYLEQCKYKMKKRELVSIIGDEVVDIGSNESGLDE